MKKSLTKHLALALAVLMLATLFAGCGAEAQPAATPEATTDGQPSGPVQGGTITLASMLPIFLFSYAYGVGPGMLVGAAYGFVQFLQGGLYFVHPIELLLDYPLAFAMLGLAGLANKFSDKWGMIPGIILGTFGRFVCAFLSGMIFFGMYAPEGQNLVVYSIVYNGLYLVPEAIICIVLALIPQIRQLAKRLALQD